MDFNFEVYGEVEFCDWCWGDLSELLGLIIFWKRVIYEKVVVVFE